MVRLGADPTTGKDVYVPLGEVPPMVHSNDLILGGWDISGIPLEKAMAHAQVLNWDLQRQVAPYMAEMGAPLPLMFYPGYIAANQGARGQRHPWLQQECSC